MIYEDFIIQISPIRDGVYPVTFRSPAGEGKSQFQPPFDPEALAATLSELGRRGEVPLTMSDQTLPQFRKLIPAGLAETTRLTPREVGGALFDALFQGEVSFDDPNFHRRELTVMSSRNATPTDFRAVIEAVENGSVATEPWITHRLTLGEVPDRFGEVIADQDLRKAVISVA